MIRYIQSILDSLALAVEIRRQIISLRLILGPNDSRSDEQILEQLFSIARVTLICGYTLDGLESHLITRAIHPDRFQEPLQ